MPEYFDVYDEEGKLTGEVVERGEVHRRGLWHKVVHVWIVNSKGDVLLQKRAQQKETYPGLWDISSAGHIDAGETSHQAALRETHEELGIAVPPEMMQVSFSAIQRQVLNGGTYINNEFVDVYVLYMDVDISTLKLQEEEVEAVKWIHYKLLREQVTKHDASLVPMDALIHGDYKRFFEMLDAKFI